MFMESNIMIVVELCKYVILCFQAGAQALQWQLQ